MRATILVHRIPIDTPVQTSFGIMHDRPSLMLRLEDDDGAIGFGEIWCNWPSVGAEHRARLMEALILPLVAESGLADNPAELWVWLSARLRILAIQSGEPGPIAQCLAGLECALQDLAARRAGLPLARFLSSEASASVAVYASGINPTGAPETAERAIAAGYRACKVKVGFGRDRDRENLLGARALIGPDVQMMADANQAWTSEEAVSFAETADEVGLSWLEEPLAHDVADEDWRQVADAMQTPLAAGENFASARDFDELPAARGLGVVQPDLGRWGGVAQLVAVGRSARAHCMLFCPHWLGGGVGLLTSCHVKAALDDEDGFVEVDFNDNPMRSELAAEIFATLRDGRVSLPDKPGIGIDDAAIDAFRAHLTVAREITF
ncbi:mandelate racemase/muconate lactonizing enzyme family protein [Jiella marina]|uniref:mandelate racemase/muconate lactonizing enzyme family protein n=1 Tax=Jiella sp. LLJ827 TaxID=2917712 RepID=UPI00210166C7|nr:mandelate racemase/muconate lactonizing enzyme family protein [Jiella sp. LLJ827]MCQ0986110.1 mandelate racemase/muconate lactonizing enzyme family protein [Jiella sp. LLJ827]